MLSETSSSYSSTNMESESGSQTSIDTDLSRYIDRLRDGQTFYEILISARQPWEISFLCERQNKKQLEEMERIFDEARMSECEKMILAGATFNELFCQK